MVLLDYYIKTFMINFMNILIQLLKSILTHHHYYSTVSLIILYDLTFYQICYTKQLRLN